MMAQPGRVFRLFVSSTFSDMATERNALQARVFPRLDALCMQHGTRFQAVDLRWGISQEAGLDQRTVSLCMEEIRRCQQTTRRPNFLLLMGQRYGWQPLPERIPAAEFEAFEPHIPDDERRARLHEWYRRDDNAVPPEYVLLPRQGEFADFERWQQVETQLVEAIREALEGLNWPPDTRRKYTTAVTEQEIQAGIFDYPHAAEGAFCFFREFDPPPDDDSAARYVEPDALAHQKLAALKNRLRDHLPGNIHEYQVAWAGDGLDAGYIDQFCAEVEARLREAILAEIATFEEMNPLEIEQAVYDDFIAERTRHFVGREDVLAVVQNFLTRESQFPLALVGPSGVGKSALMARAIEQAQGDAGELVYRFIGVTPDSSDIRLLLVSLCQDIARRYGYEADIPADYDELVGAWPDFLAQATAERPLLIFLDALDQLAERHAPHNLRWLPDSLPPPVKLVMSCTPGPYAGALVERLPPESLVPIQPLSPADAATLLDHWLADAGRSLQPAQRREVLDKFNRSGLALYLKLAFEEARLWPSYSPPLTLGEDVPSLLRENLFSRLSQPAHHGEMLVSRSLGYLAAARHGLAETEVLAVLAADDEYWAHFTAGAFHDPIGRRLPVVVWSRLAMDLGPYLIERGADNAALLAFYHRQFSEVVTADYLAGEVKAARHAHLAGYFEQQPLYLGDRPNARKVAEQAYQQARAGMAGAWKASLLEVDFLHAAVRVRGPQAVMEDCVLLDDRDVRLVRSALGMSAHVLVDDPAQLASHLYGRLLSYGDERPAMGGLLGAIAGHEWLPALLTKTQTMLPAGGALVRTIQVNNPAYSFAFSPDGRHVLSCSRDKQLRLWAMDSGTVVRAFTGHSREVWAVAFSPDGSRALSGSRDSTLKLWAVDSSSPGGTSIRTFEGHSGAVDAVAFSPDGTRALSGAADNVVKLWNVDSGQLLDTFSGHTDQIFSLAFEPHGDLAVSASRDSTVKVWDVAQSRLIHTLEGHTKPVMAVCFSPDGRHLISGSADGTLKLWDVSKGTLVRTFAVGGPVNAVAYSPDGQFVLSGSGSPRRPDSHALRLWEVDSGRLLSAFEGHTSYIIDLSFLPNGQYALTGAADGLVRLWDLDTPDDSRALEAHTNTVNAVALSVDERYVLTGCYDGVLKLWDLTDGHLVRTFLEQHGNWVWSLSFSPDGSLALSSAFDDSIKLWQVSTGQLIRTIEVEPDEGGGLVAFSADSQYIIQYGIGVFDVWLTETGQFVENLEETDDTRMSLEHKYGVTLSINPSEGNPTRYASGLRIVRNGDDNRCFDLMTDGTITRIKMSGDLQVIAGELNTGRVHILHPNPALRRLLTDGKNANGTPAAPTGDD